MLYHKDAFNCHSRTALVRRLVIQDNVTLLELSQWLTAFLLCYHHIFIYSHSFWITCFIMIYDKEACNCHYKTNLEGSPFYWLFPYSNFVLFHRNSLNSKPTYVEGSPSITSFPCGNWVCFFKAIPQSITVLTGSHIHYASCSILHSMANKHAIVILKTNLVWRFTLLKMFHSIDSMCHRISLHMLMYSFWNHIDIL
jgi:hypothetical protein